MTELPECYRLTLWDKIRIFFRWPLHYRVMCTEFELRRLLRYEVDKELLKELLGDGNTQSHQ